MSKLRLKLYSFCITFVVYPVITSPAFAISNQSVVSLAREDYPIVTPLENYIPIQEANADEPLEEAIDIPLEVWEEIIIEEVIDAPSAFNQALKLGEEATEQAEVAATSENWGNVSRKWLEAIELLQQASQDETQRSAALQKIEEFQQNLAYSTSQFFTLTSEEEATRREPRLSSGMATVPIDNSSAFQEELTEYNAWVLTHRKNTFRLSLYSSIAIFALVVIIVMAGLLLSYEQLRKGLSSETNFSVKEGTVEISSSIIGFLVLFLSLAFFYLYLREVYPIPKYRTKVVRTAKSQTHTTPMD